MRILVLSDIHANVTALNAALEAAKDRWDHIACLGDVVGYEHALEATEPDRLEPLG